MSAGVVTDAFPVSPLLTRRVRLWPVVLVSAAVHAALILAATLHRPTARIDLQQKPIVAKLVRLGEKRPEQWLPRKESAPPPAATSPTAQPTPTPAPAPPTAPSVSIAAPKSKPSPPAAKSSTPSAKPRNDVLASALSKMQRDRISSDPVYGDPQGDPMGDSSDASAGDQYLALVVRALRESYVLPATLSERDRLHLNATVVLYLDDDGRVMRFAFERPSGNGAFDAALERAIRAARLPPPPPDLKKKYRNEGLGVLYRP
jgi:colicin import membrane protein/protein TonB